MKKLLHKLSINKTYKKILKEPITYVAGAVILALLQVATFVTSGKGWGVTSTFAYWGTWIAKPFANIGSWAWFNNEAAQKTLSNGFLNNGGSIRDVGIMAGAFLAVLFASQFKLKKIKSKKQIVAAIIGGLMMGYGARLANGCNVGALFTGITFFSLAGWVFAFFLAVGAFFGCKLLKKYFI